MTFDWQLRLSSRAKRPRLTISHAGKVELVWPKRMPKKFIPLMLDKHKAWVESHLNRLGTRAGSVVAPPEEIEFKLLNKLCSVNYEPVDNVKVRVLNRDNEVLLRGDINDYESVRKTLGHWVKSQAKQILPDMLERQAKVMELRYESLSIRLQKHRWGSCSKNRRINLNAALLFLPCELVQHVMIHELAHLKHLNHSKEFWQYVAKFDPHYLEHRKQLKAVAQEVPAWLALPFEVDYNGDKI